MKTILLTSQIRCHQAKNSISSGSWSKTQNGGQNRIYPSLTLLTFSSLHPCVKTSLTERIDMFLPQAKTEVMEKMERLISLLVQRIIVLTSSVLAKRRLARGIQQLYYMAFYALATTYTPDAPPPLDGYRMLYNRTSCQTFNFSAEIGQGWGCTRGILMVLKVLQ